MHFQVMIPTRNSSQWIVLFLQAYRDAGIEPLYVVDSRSNDSTERLLRSAGAQVSVFTPHGDYVEAGMIAFGSQQAETDWILRMDDDEFPSRRLLAWAEETGCSSEAAQWGISRRELFKHEDQIKYSRHEACYYMGAKPDFLNPQFRLYRRSQVTFIEEIHTPGFEVGSYIFAPEDAYFLHFDRLLRSPAVRLEKLRTYESAKPGSSWRFAHLYLPELFPEIDQKAVCLETDEFDGLFAALPKQSDEEVELTPRERDLISAGSAELMTTILNDRRLRLQGDTPPPRRRFGQASVAAASLLAFLNKLLPMAIPTQNSPPH